jgi:methylated-DNA-protein-cysteine methyltransferase related protein
MKMKTQTDESFFEKVYDVVRQIPLGKVTSYGAIARAIGSPQAARMVGWAMNGSHAVEPYVPAHRVVNRNGLLTGKNHFGGIETMKEMLMSEDIQVINDKIVNFSVHFWDPMNEMI